MYQIEQWDEKLKQLVQVYQNITDDVEYKKAEPATEKEVQALEKKLGYQLPFSLRKALLEVSKELVFTAYLPDDYEFEDEELEEIFSAEIHFSLEEILEAEVGRKEWIKTVFDNEEDEYDMEWYHKLGFMEVGNGDIIAFDLLDEKEDKRVVYLSHEDGPGHGCILGETFGDFMENFILIGGCGPEDSQLLIFVDDDKGGINPECNNAKIYRNLIHLDW